MDWSATPLGSMSSAAEPQDERRHRARLGIPQILLWGPELVQIYNDGYREIMGASIRLGLACPHWSAVRDRAITKPIYDRVLAGET